MKKYNLSKIMKRAHEIKKENRNYIWSICLKAAWAEEKSHKSEKEMLLDRLNAKVIEANSNGNGYQYEISVNDWENYGKSRTYFAIIKKRDCSKHYSKITYGFYDNKAKKYVADKYGDLTQNFTVSGSRM